MEKKFQKFLVFRFSRVYRWRPCSPLTDSLLRKRVFEIRKGGVAQFSENPAIKRVSTLSMLISGL